MSVCTVRLVALKDSSYARTLRIGHHVEYAKRMRQEGEAVERVFDDCFLLESWSLSLAMIWVFVDWHSRLFVDVCILGRMQNHCYLMRISFFVVVNIVYGAIFPCSREEDKDCRK